jgi:hypothetical protein
MAQEVRSKWKKQMKEVEAVQQGALQQHDAHLTAVRGRLQRVDGWRTAEIEAARDAAIKRVHDAAAKAVDAMRTQVVIVQSGVDARVAEVSAVHTRATHAVDRIRACMPLSDVQVIGHAEAMEQEVTGVLQSSAEVVSKPAVAVDVEVVGLAALTAPLPVVHAAPSMHNVVKMGSALFEWGKKGGGAGEFDTPCSLCFLDSRIYVADKINCRVVVLDATTGVHVRSFGKPGRGNGELKCPVAVCSGPDNLLYVVDRDNCRIQVRRSSAAAVRGRRGWDAR